jgi:hypothetical protein
MRTLIKVTRKDIKNSIANLWTQCPVALAIERALVIERALASLYQLIERQHNRSSLIQAIEDWNFHIPRSVKRFIKRFDAGKPVKPFNFFLES